MSTFYYGIDNDGNTFNVSDNDPTSIEKFNEIKNLDDKISRAKNKLEEGYDIYKDLSVTQINREIDNMFKDRYEINNEPLPEYISAIPQDGIFLDLQSFFNKNINEFNESLLPIVDSLNNESIKKQQELLNNPAIYNKVISDPKLKKIKEEVEKKQEDYFKYGKGKKIIEDYNVYNIFTARYIM